MSDVPKIDSELFKVRNRATYHRNSMRGLSMSVLRSLMQKALRMGETDLAMRSAAEMDLSGNGKALFVRMKTVACEDFGVGSIGLLPFLFKQHELWNHTLGKGGRTSQSSTIKEARRILMSTVHAMCDKSQRLRRNRDAPMGSIVALSMLEDLKSPLECPLNTLPLISKHELVTKRLRKAILEEKIEILALQVVMMARVRGVEEQAMVTLQEIADERQRINSHDISGVAATIRCLCSLRSKKSDNRLFSAHAVQLLLLSEANRKLNMDPKMVMLSQSLVDSMYQRKIKMEEIPERVFDKHTGGTSRHCISPRPTPPNLTHQPLSYSQESS